MYAAGIGTFVRRILSLLLLWSLLLSRASRRGGSAITPLCRGRRSTLRLSCRPGLPTGRISADWLADSRESSSRLGSCGRVSRSPHRARWRRARFRGHRLDPNRLLLRQSAQRQVGCGLHARVMRLRLVRDHSGLNSNLFRFFTQRSRLLFRRDTRSGPSGGVRYRPTTSFLSLIHI